MKIALDVAGGDYGFAPNLEGLRYAMDDQKDVEQFLLVGPVDEMKAALSSYDLSADDPRLEFVQASQVVEMHEPSSVALRKKRDSSITVAATLLKEGRADAMISAGHTGASVAANVVINRMLPGVERPGIAAVFPSPHGQFVMLDVGANVDATAPQLGQYAILGEAYTRMILGVEKPRVGLMSVGAEDGKGNKLTKAAGEILSQLPLNYIGNVEGHDLFGGGVDVVVCDGFVGNAVLKSCESLAKAITTILKENLQKSPVRTIGAALAKGAFAELKEMMDHEETGGAPLLGINGVCIIAHGSSSAKSIRNAFRVASDMVRKEVNRQVADKLAESRDAFAADAEEGE
jgi:glycerol-3-phosphate acyltransferase PlsX